MRRLQVVNKLIILGVSQVSVKYMINIEAICFTDSWSGRLIDVQAAQATSTHANATATVDPFGAIAWNFAIFVIFLPSPKN